MSEVSTFFAGKRRGRKNMQIGLGMLFLGMEVKCMGLGGDGTNLWDGG